MGQALYRKYRSKSLGELVGQEHVTQTLANALKAGRISHAYLLTGPRGSGKTSIARILAHEINGLPYDDETNHLDIIEIDAASNNGVEDVRDLREKVRLAPTSAKFKVYIIDEVHMLSGAAFNALLKTLEEPPAHAVFILATTEVHKLPATIISRTQRFQLAPVAIDKVAAHLRFIADQEKIEVDDAALELIAEHGDGAFRDSISLLDQLRSVAERVTTESVEQTLGLAPKPAIEQLLQALLAGDVVTTVSSYKSLLGSGASPAILSSQLMSVMGHFTAQHPALYQLIDQLIEVPRAYSPRLKLEVVLASFALSRAEPQTQPATQPIAQSQAPTATPAPKKETPPAATPKPQPAKVVTVESAPAPIPVPAPVLVSAPVAATAPVPAAEPVPTAQTASLASATGSGGKLGTLTDEIWQQIGITAKEGGATLYTVLRQAIPHFDVEKQLLTITFRFGLHQKRFEESAHAHEFRNILQQVWGGVPEIQVILNKNAVRHIGPANTNNTTAAEALPESPATSSVLSMMGGGEVVNEPLI